MKRRYWVVSPNVLNDGNISYWLKKSKDENKVFVGYGSDKKLGERFDTTVKINDCVIIAQGAKDNRTLYRIGIINSSRQFEETEEVFYRDVNYLLSKKDVVDSEIGLNSNNAFFESNNPGTIYELKRENKFDKNVMDKIESAFKHKLELINMKDKIELLEYKKQIILQGPPGTGKTRLAKLIAEEMTKALEIINPSEKIDTFFKSTDTLNPVFLERREKHKFLLEKFQQKFPIDSILNISKENYALGTGTNDSFCWWIERGLQPLGYYFPGSARSYMLFWKKSIADYSKHGFVKDSVDNDAAMKKIAEQLYEAVENKKYSEVSKYLGYGFLLKILHSYYPSKFFPINSVVCIENALKIFNVDYSKMNPFEKNVKLQEIYNQKKSEFKTDITNIEFMKFLFDEFELKGNIEIDSNNLIRKGKYKIIQFHPAYSYEDFVRGITAKTNEKGDVNYTVENRILVEFANEALDNPKSKYVLIIDEINRANLPSVLGELIYALEYRFKHGLEDNSDNEVESLYDISDDENESNRVLKLPDNLFIIGTMNTSDRSVGHIDYAIRRRFAFVDVLPNIEPISAAGIDKFKTVCELFIEEYDAVDWNNPKFKPSKHISSDFKPEDVMIGHSYFITKEKDEDGKPLDEIKQIDLKLKYEIIPILKEYIKDGILKQSKEIETLISSL